MSEPLAESRHGSENFSFRLVSVGDELDEWIAGTLRRTGRERLPAHLGRRYGVRVTAMRELDLGVYRIDREGGSSWVARVFPAARPLEEVEGDAAILRALENAGFPAERCAHPESVSVHDGQGVLVTEFVKGVRPESWGRVFAYLGGLLGRLHARSGSSIRVGGAWHHMVPSGGPTEEVAATKALVARMESRLRGHDRAPYDILLGEVEELDDCRDLPQAFVHPDFVPANAIPTADGKVTIVDWTGAGRGPRLWSIGFLLWAAGARNLALVETVLSRYRRHVRLEPAELDRLNAAIRARPLVIDCWSVCTGRKHLTEVVEELPARDRLVDAITRKARESAAAGE